VPFSTPFKPIGHGLTVAMETPSITRDKQIITLTLGVLRELRFGYIGTSSSKVMASISTGVVKISYRIIYPLSLERASYMLLLNCNTIKSLMSIKRII
jgi:hypothetical protein